MHLFCAQGQALTKCRQLASYLEMLAWRTPVETVQSIAVHLAECATNVYTVGV